MHTYCTQILYDKEQSFKDYVWRCANTLGARKEDPPDITNYSKEITNFTKKIADLNKKSKKECNEEAKIEFINLTRQQIIENKRLIRYNKMLTKVEEWNPPTSQYENLKEFMISQLKLSIKYSKVHKINKISGSKWKNLRNKEYKNSIKFYENLIKEELKNSNDKANFYQILQDNLTEI